MHLYPLQPDEVHLWAFAWPALPPDSLKGATEWLSPEERERADRFKIAADRTRFCLSRAFLRLLGGHYTWQDGKSLKLETAAQGKPLFTGTERPLHFNMSHSGAWIVMAFSAAHPVGIDVQAIDPRPDFDISKLARRYFHEAEIKALETQPEEQKIRLFFDIWTAKEACLKAAGTGIQGGLDNFSVVPLPAQEQWKTLEGFSLYPLPMQNGYAAALALHAPAQNPAVRRFGFSDLGWPAPNFE